MTHRNRGVGPALLLVAAGCGNVDGPAPGVAVNELADRYYAAVLDYQPERAYFAGLDLDRHDGLSDNRPEALAAHQVVLDQLQIELAEIDVEELRGRPEWITAAFLSQSLAAEQALRICRNELWNVNQMGGWQLGYPRVAELQPVDSPEQRAQALQRWQAFPGYIDQEIANLRLGLRGGYSAPKTVVQRVIGQVDGLLAMPTDESPFYSPAVRSDDPGFAAKLRAIAADGIYPALERYRNFLAEDYLPDARDALSITANPDGAACYAASLFHYTTLNRSGEEVYRLGERTVAANRDAVIELGKDRYGSEDFAGIIAAAKADPADRFDSADELLAFSRAAVRRAEAEMPNWVGNMPAQPAEVVPFEPHLEGTGRSAHYRPGTEDRPGEYRIPLYKAEEQSRGNAEATAFHEVWPGHHLQVATAQAVPGLHPITELVWFSGPGEGWARYSEALAEEMGLYQTDTGPILRRAWPARGMVVDPGIHLFGWTREQAKDYVLVSGRFPPSQADPLVDRIAILPGQLTAYDSGGLEILALRREAEAALGDAFDVREFHDRILENGTIPLGFLRTHVEAWIAAKAAN